MIRHVRQTPALLAQLCGAAPGAERQPLPAAALAAAAPLRQQPLLAERLKELRVALLPRRVAQLLPGRQGVGEAPDAPQALPAGEQCGRRAWDRRNGSLSGLVSVRAAGRGLRQTMGP